MSPPSPHRHHRCIPVTSPLYPSDVICPPLTGHHVGVSAVGDGEDVGRHLIAPAALVDVDGAVGVDGEALVGVNGHAEQAGVGVDQLNEVALLQVVEHRGVVEVGQVGHVLAFLVLGRVHLGDLLLLEVLLLWVGDEAGQGQGQGSGSAVLLRNGTIAVFYD